MILCPDFYFSWNRLNVNLSLLFGVVVRFLQMSCHETANCVAIFRSISEISPLHLSFSVCRLVPVTSLIVWGPHIDTCPSVCCFLVVFLVLIYCVLLLLSSEGLLEFCLIHGTKHFRIPLTTPILQFPALFQKQWHYSKTQSIVFRSMS